MDLGWLEVCVGSGLGASKAAILLSQTNSLRHYPPRQHHDPLDERRLTRLRGWISACHKDHLCANYRYSQRNPTWLIRILGGGYIRLVGASTHDNLVKYVALSYCWGDEQSIRASNPQLWERVMNGHTVNVSQRQGPFPVTELPETLQDAITLTHHLGIEHIWIDSVCVPRGSWDTESATMHEVYGNAALTLSASSTTAATDRMLTAQDAWRDASRGCRLHEPWLLGTDMSIDEMRLRSPVAARGWILQEERLSPRILYWCAQRAYWSCTECQRIELKQPGGVWQQPSLGLSHPQRFVQLCRGGDTNLLRREWCDLVASFARRSLSSVSVESNRFAAFSGLAVRYLSSSNSGSQRDEYLAGLWRNSLAQNLAWEVKPSVPPEASLQHAIPSWSWLSLPLGTEMRMPPDVDPSSYFHVQTASAIQEGDTDQDIVSKGAKVRSLEVVGRFRRLIADAEAARVPWEGIEREKGGFDFSLDPARSLYARNSIGKIMVYEPHKEEVIVQLDYLVSDISGVEYARTAEVQEGHERQLHCLELADQAMLLLERSTTGTTNFRRVGVSLSYRRDFFDGASTVEITIL